MFATRFDSLSEEKEVSDDVEQERGIKSHSFAKVF
jgi:hypothetical protein